MQWSLNAEPFIAVYGRSLGISIVYKLRRVSILVSHAIANVIGYLNRPQTMNFIVSVDIR